MTGAERRLLMALAGLAVNGVDDGIRRAVEDVVAEHEDTPQFKDRKMFAMAILRNEEKAEEVAWITDNPVEACRRATQILHSYETERDDKDDDTL